MSESGEVTEERTWSGRGRYQPRRSLGAGGGGWVWLAHDRELDRLVAIKELTTRLHDPEARARFAREARITASLAHPHLVEIYDFDVGPKGDPYIVYEYLEGGTLADLLERDPDADCRHLLELAIQVASALATLHEAGVLHRDLKPANVLLRASGEAVLADLGLALSEEEPESLTVTGVVVGTPAYLAPELWRGGDSTPAADQFALAAMVLRAVYGASVYPDEAFADIRAWLDQDRDLEIPGRADVPPDLEAVIRRGLRLDPEARWPDVRAFAAALREVHQDRGPEGSPGGPRAPATRRGGPALLLAGLVALAGWAVRAPDIPRPTAPPELPLSVASLDTARARVLEHLDETDAPLRSPDGTHLREVAPRLADPRFPLMVTRLLEELLRHAQAQRGELPLALLNQSRSEMVRASAWLAHIDRDVRALTHDPQRAVAEVLDLRPGTGDAVTKDLRLLVNVEAGWGQVLDQAGAVLDQLLPTRADEPEANLHLLSTLQVLAGRPDVALLDQVAAEVERLARAERSRPMLRLATALLLLQERLGAAPPEVLDRRSRAIAAVEGLIRPGGVRAAPGLLGNALGEALLARCALLRVRAPARAEDLAPALRTLDQLRDAVIPARADLFRVWRIRCLDALGQVPPDDPRARLRTALSDG